MSAQPTLFLKSLHEENQFYKIDDLVNIGSDLGCQIRIAGAEDRHAKITRRGDRYLIRDLQAQSTTQINGVEIQEAYLNIDDEIQIAKTSFVVTSNSTPTVRPHSRNEEWDKQLQRLPHFALSPFPVFLSGPSGSGKEVLARYLHENSKRASGPYVIVNCASLSENLVESELFGHTKGSFTGALETRLGAFETARGGTLFLDEIGDLPLSLQAKLLRAIENKEIRAVGSDRVTMTDVRIICATHKDLLGLVKRGAFREDLYFRLNICRVELPRLTRRMEDFDDLLYTFAKEFRVRFSFMAIKKMKEHSWPGNVRELKNSVARAAALFRNRTVEVESLTEIIDSLPATSVAAPQLASSSNLPFLRQLEKDLILERLVMNGGNQRKTAEELGLPKSTLHDRLKSYQIDLRDYVPTMRKRRVRITGTEPSSDSMSAAAPNENIFS